MDNIFPENLRQNARTGVVSAVRQAFCSTLLLVSVGILNGCAGIASTLDPAGPQAERIAVLHWIMFGVGGAVYAGVLGLLFFAVWRSQRRAAAEPDDARGTLLIVGGGIVLPLLVLFPLWGLTLTSMNEIAEPPQPPRLTIEITGHQWWYEVRYPDHGVTTAGEVHIPAGEPVLFELRSVDVIHSFWAPRLAGKTDMVPGVVNRMWLEASQPGTYLVECAEFCGLMHAKMQMPLYAESPEDFAAWLASQRK
ncbi:MAG: cytochrome c oxidase subunit II [Chloroflexi bacterium]|nr:cytochrome c oxidase subunit II [Chloroflexota bacterium]